MQTVDRERTTEIEEELGADRVLDGSRSLPQRAQRLDPSPPVRPHELELEVDVLCLDSTSHREIRERAGAESAAMAARIAEIVAERGKMHNPATDSGGILRGTVSAIGERFPDPPRIGDRVATLGSLTQTALRLDEVVRADPDSAQVEVRGRAYLFARAPWAPMPADLPPDRVLELFDVCAAASQLRDLVPTSGTVCVLGAGHAGKLAMAAARAGLEDGTVIAVDVDAAAIERAAECGLCDVGVVTDLRDPIGAERAVREAGGGPAELTVVVVNARDCEPAAILLTAERGTVLFFSMATGFSAASLAADGIARDVRMLVGSGYPADRGAHALELVRQDPGLREALGIELGTRS